MSHQGDGLTSEKWFAFSNVRLYVLMCTPMCNSEKVNWHMHKYVGKVRTWREYMDFLIYEM